MSSGYTFILATWHDDAEDIRAVRDQVWKEAFGDGWPAGDRQTEEQSFHVLAYDAAGRAVGAARMQADGCIDYVAVRRPWRGVTVGGALLAYLLHIARVRGIERVWTIVPPPAQKFFAKNRFVAAGDDSAGEIAGRRWERRVSTNGERSGSLQ